MRHLLAAIALLLSASGAWAGSSNPTVLPAWVPKTLPGSTGNVLFNNAGALGATTAVTVSGTEAAIAGRFDNGPSAAGLSIPTGGNGWEAGNYYNVFASTPTGAGTTHPVLSTFSDNNFAPLWQCGRADGTFASPTASATGGSSCAILSYMYVGPGGTATAGWYNNAIMEIGQLYGTPINNTDIVGQFQLGVTVGDNTGNTAGMKLVGDNGKNAQTGPPQAWFTNDMTARFFHTGFATSNVFVSTDYEDFEIVPGTTYNVGPAKGGAGTLRSMTLTGTSVNVNAAGSAAAPAFTLDGDNTSGLYRPASNYLCFASSTTETACSASAGFWEVVAGQKSDTWLSLGGASLTLSSGEMGFAKITASGSAPGAGGGKMEFVCGTNAGSLKIIAYGGTSTTPVTVTDNIGSGATGC